MMVKWINMVVVVLVLLACSNQTEAPIKIGILHSLTGTMAFSELDLVDTLTLAVEEINARGGVLGRQLEIVVADGASDETRFAVEAHRLIVKELVPVIFGCWTSVCRKAVKPVVEKYNHLLFYPLQYEGLEQSDNIIYTGATPNQQIIPSVHWALEHIGKRVYLIGSDYVFPRTANMIIKDLLKSRNIEPLAEAYLPLGSHDVLALVKHIRQLKPDLILNTINGDSNIAFFQSLGGLEKTKVLSYSIAESEINKIGIELLAGHYAAWNYFQSIDNIENQQFVTHFKQRFGQNRVVDDPMEAAYIGVHLWAQAAETAGTTEPQQVRAALGYQSFKAPQGVVTVDASTGHLWKMARIGKVLDDGQFDIVWSSERPIRPSPFPSYHSKTQWLKRAGGLE